jgi:hypothetical protein
MLMRIDRRRMELDWDEADDDDESAVCDISYTLRVSMFDECRAV